MALFLHWYHAFILLVSIFKRSYLLRLGAYLQKCKRGGESGQKRKLISLPDTLLFWTLWFRRLVYVTYCIKPRVRQLWIRTRHFSLSQL